jgi:MOSC domain-containing protein YiiM
MKRDASTSERFSTQFNADSLLPLLTSGKSQPQTRRQQGISGVSFGTLKRGKIRNGDYPNCIYEDTNSEFSVLQKENLRLKQENKILRQQSEILRKSISTFSSDPLQRRVS